MMHVNADVTTFNSTKPGAKLGEIYEAPNGARYKHVLVVGTSGDLAAGDLVVNADASLATAEAPSGSVVTRIAASAIDETLGTVAHCAGVAVGTISTGNYGWVQVWGVGSCKTDGGVVEGDALVVDGGATPVRVADTAVAGEEHAVFGVALATDDSDPKVTFRFTKEL